MLNERYNFDFDAEFKVFEFDSIGPNGTVRKIVQYAETNLYKSYNLGFGDKDYVTNEVSDVAITNNNDSQKVLATVAATLLTFTEQYPDAFVMATGCTAARTLDRVGLCSVPYERLHGQSLWCPVSRAVHRCLR